MKTRAAALALLTLFALPQARGQEKTYSGRDFENWKTLAVNDLNPETRYEAMKAIGVLGHHGHRAEAVRFVEQVVDSEPELSVRGAAYEALLTFGDDAAPAIVAGLKGNEMKKGLVLYAFLLAEYLSPIDREGKDYRTGQADGSAVVASPARNAGKRELTAAVVLHQIFSAGAPDDLAEAALPILMEAARSDNEDVASECIDTIGFFGKHAAPAIPLLIGLSWLGKRRRKPKLASPLDGNELVGWASPLSTRWAVWDRSPKTRCRP